MQARSELRGFVGQICRRLVLKKPFEVNAILRREEEVNHNSLTSIDDFIHYLLQVTAEHGLLLEMHQLFDKYLFFIDDTCHYKEDMTLLGVAAFNGQVEIVKYLVETRAANVNKQDGKGNTALHHVIYGDSHPYHHFSLGKDHNEVAKYLFKQGAKLTIENQANKKPFDLLLANEPFAIERVIGKRLIALTDSFYLGDQVRPVFEKEVAKQKRLYMLPIIGSRRPKHLTKTFERFRLESAITSYVNKDTVGFGYKNIEEVIKQLRALSEVDKYFYQTLLDMQRPDQTLSKHDLIKKKLPNIAQRSGQFGAAIMLMVYYQTQHLLLAVSAGALSARMAFVCLSEYTYQQKQEKRKLQDLRISELSHGLFTPAKAKTTAIEAPQPPIWGLTPNGVK